MFVIAVAIAIILPADLAANNVTTSNMTTVTANVNETTAATTTSEIYNATTTTPMNTTTNPATDDNSTNAVTVGSPTTTAESESISNETTQTEMATTTVTDSPTTNPPTTAATTLLVADIVQQNWTAVVSAINFSQTVLDGFNATTFDGSDFLDAAVEYYKAANETQLQAFLQENKIDVVSSSILENATDVLDTTTRQKFNTSSASALQGFYAAMNWMKDFVLLENSERFSSLLQSYESDKSDSVNATIEGFVIYILSNVPGSEMFDAVCNASRSAGITASQCSTSTTPTETTIEKFTNSWQLILDYNFTNLDASEKQELEAISSNNMTESLATYVSNMPDAEIQDLLDVNATAFVSERLRENSNSVTEYLGVDAVAILGNNATKQDVYFLYLNFMNGLLSSPESFKTVLDAYLATNSSQSVSRRKKRSTGCEQSTINSDGLTCHIITVNAQNITSLVNTVCGEFTESSACKLTFIVDTTSTTATSSGVPIGVIIGGAIGGFCALLLLIIISYFIWRRCNGNQSKVNPQENSISHDERNDMAMNENSDRAQNGNANRRASNTS